MTDTADKEPSISSLARQWAKLPCNSDRNLNLQHSRTFSQLTGFKQTPLSTYTDRAIPLGKFSLQAFNKRAASAHAALLRDLKLNKIKFRNRSAPLKLFNIGCNFSPITFVDIKTKTLATDNMLISDPAKPVPASSIIKYRYQRKLSYILDCFVPEDNMQEIDDLLDASTNSKKPSSTAK